MKIFLRLLTVFALLTPCGEALAAGPGEGYNVVLVFIDALRADHLPCYGYNKDTAPALGELARESFVFERNFVTASYTLASLASVNTSLYPASHGVREVFKDKLPSRVKTLAQILGFYGYRSAWVGPARDPHTDPDTQLFRGFDELILGKCDDLAEFRRTLCEWIGKNKDNRFFLNFHTYKVHDPYCPSPRYKSLFVTEDREDVPDSDQEMKDISASCDAHPNIELSQRMSFRTMTEYFAYWRRLKLDDPSYNAYARGLYDACIREFDEEVMGPVVRQLKSLGLYEKTVIVVFADHGDEFYEHGGYGHGRTFYDEVARVPLIVKVPGQKRGRRVKGLSQNIDIMPTILGLLDIPVPKQAQGRDWSGYLRGKAAAPAYGFVLGQNSTMSYLRSKQWKYVKYHDCASHELYDLRDDPGEQRNLAGKRPWIERQMESLLRERESAIISYKEQEDAYPPEIDKGTQERIRKTGYW